MTSRISVERQFRFHCSCGATTVSGERKVICTGCGDTLGIRRIRRHRQGRDSVAYYGSSAPARRIESRREQPNTDAAIRRTPIAPRWTNPVRRVERLRQDPNLRASMPGTGVGTRLAVWLKSAVAWCSGLLALSLVGKHTQHAKKMLNLEAQEARYAIADSPRRLPGINASPVRPLLYGAHVMVGPNRPDGKPHPHAGKTGRIVRFIDPYSEPYKLGAPSALIELDSAIWPGQFIWVSLECLEAQPEDPPTPNS
jgi:hypothetical protein